MHRLTYANVVSSIALFMAISGVAWAATTLPRNSVGAEQIRKDGVGAAEIRRDAVSRAEIKRGGVGADEVDDGTLTAAEFAPGIQFKGDKGDPGVLASATVQTEIAAAADGASVSVDAFCPQEQKAIGGGGRADDNGDSGAVLISSRPARGPTDTEPPADGETFAGWRVTAFNPSGGDATIQPEVWVVCAT